ncbi:MAG: SulP family inorganic anion transporter [Smithellaceae bacterium]
MASPQTPVGSPFVRRERPRGLYRLFPILATLRDYKRAWLVNDIAAGIVLTAILVPVGMGYAAASGLPAIYGLYATIIPLIVYGIFGPSRILVLGPDSALAGLIAAAIVPLAAGNADKAVALAGMLAVLTGALCIAAGLARFGFITDLLSKPIRMGYLNGIALTVLIGQLPKVLGFSVSGNSFLTESGNLAQGIWNGQINWIAFAIGFSCLIIILGFRHWAPRIPGVLIAVAGATIIVSFLDPSIRKEISLIGPLPQGLPQFHIPAVSVSEFRDLFMAAIAIALVSFADMSTLSRTFALRAGRDVDSNQEIIALGTANIVTGFFQGFPVSSSASRTPVAESAGAKTQITGVVGAVCIALLLIFAPKLLQNLPHAALGAIVICACISLVEIRSVLRLFKLRRDEFVLSVVCFLGVVLLGVIQGIFIAIGLALAAFIWRAWRPYDAVLGHVDGLKSYHDVSRYPEAKRIPGLVLFRWDAPLFFANAETFRDQVLRAVAHASTPTKWVVIAAEPITDVDITAADVLADLDELLHQAGMDLCFAEMKDPVKDRLKCYGLFNRLGTENFFPTIEQAVECYTTLQKTGANKYE